MAQALMFVHRLETIKSTKILPLKKLPAVRYKSLVSIVYPKKATVTVYHVSLFRRVKELEVEIAQVKSDQTASKAALEKANVELKKMKKVQKVHIALSSCG